MYSGDRLSIVSGLADRTRLRAGINIGMGHMRVDVPDPLKYTPPHNDDLGWAPIAGVPSDPSFTLSQVGLYAGIEFDLIKFEKNAITLSGGVTYLMYSGGIYSREKYGSTYSSHTYLDTEIDSEMHLEPYVELMFIGRSNSGRMGIGAGIIFAEDIEMDIERGWNRYDNDVPAYYHFATLETHPYYIKMKMGMEVGIDIEIRLEYRRYDVTFDTGDTSDGEAWQWVFRMGYSW